MMSTALSQVLPRGKRRVVFRPLRARQTPTDRQLEKHQFEREQYRRQRKHSQARHGGVGARGRLAGRGGNGAPRRRGALCPPLSRRIVSKSRSFVECRVFFVIICRHQLYSVIYFVIRYLSVYLRYSIRCTSTLFRFQRSSKGKEHPLYLDVTRMFLSV